MSPRRHHNHHHQNHNNNNQQQLNHSHSSNSPLENSNPNLVINNNNNNNSSSSSSTSTSSASSSPSKNRMSKSNLSQCHHQDYSSSRHHHLRRAPVSPLLPISAQPQAQAYPSSSQHFQLSSSPSSSASSSIPHPQLLYSAWSPSSQHPLHPNGTFLLQSSSPSSNHRNSSHHSNSNHSRDGRSNNQNRRTSSNTVSIRHHNQQAQAQARAQAHVQAQVQAAQLQIQAQAQHLSHYQQHTAELAAYITQVFLPSVLPTPEEYQVKEQTRQYLETLADKVSKGARLLPFGSIASGLALRNSDMDLCCLLGSQDGNKIEGDDRRAGETDQASSSQSTSSELQAQNLTSNEPAEQKKPKPSPAEMVLILGKLIQEETAFMVKMLPKARIPIIKLSLPPSLGQPFGLSCDIGFENRLALENTRLLLTYAMVDPRMRTMVLFLKVWTKRRKINDPYLGTLSSYGYVLMVIYYLVNGRKAAVLPNLQQLPPPRMTPPEELVYEGHDIYFFDDLDALPRYWTGVNCENVGELLIDFFRFFSNSFRYNHDVISVRSPGGLLSKESKGWINDFIEEGKDGRGGYTKVDLNRLCIEDPFQVNYNVARTVTRDGLFTIRGEFMRAVRVLSTRTDRLDVMIRELCEERQEGVLMAPPSSSGRRKSAPITKLSPGMSQSPQFNEFRNSTRNWSDEDDLREQLLLQQQHQASAAHASISEHLASYPPLTTRLMQDHVYNQGTSSMDARPRYPPESIASEPAPIDRDMDWNRDTINNYLSNGIQQLHLQQQVQQNSMARGSLSTTTPTSKQKHPSNLPTNSQPHGSAHYFHQFFQTAVKESSDPNASAATSTTSGRNANLLISPQLPQDREEVNPGSPLSPASAALLISQDNLENDITNRDISHEDQANYPYSDVSESLIATRHTSYPTGSDCSPQRLSHSSNGGPRRRAEPQQTPGSMATLAWAPLAMTNSIHGRIPDFSCLPTPGPIRFGNFGAAEKLLKQKLDQQQQILGGSFSGAFCPSYAGYISLVQHDFQDQPSNAHQKQECSSYQSLANRQRGYKEVYSECENLDPRNQVPEEPGTHSRIRSMSNGASSQRSSSLNNHADFVASTQAGEVLANQPGSETPRAASGRSPVSLGYWSSNHFHSLRSSGSFSSKTSSNNDCATSSGSSPAQLPRKIVFGDVEVPTETAKEVRSKALAAVLRTRRMSSLASSTSSVTEKSYQSDVTDGPSNDFSLRDGNGETEERIECRAEEKKTASSNDDLLTIGEQKADISNEMYDKKKETLDESLVSISPSAVAQPLNDCVSLTSIDRLPQPSGHQTSNKSQSSINSSSIGEVLVG
ncbi:hypothetical protein BY996DRAFT_4584636 [Phakopsora pachyrhizi]|nr:hypothetical protein BY996DRAFT_4584636 [Phakopsora pachyrhizi]